MTGTQELTVKIPQNEWMSSNEPMYWADMLSRTERLRQRGYFEAQRNGLLPMPKAFITVHVQYAPNVQVQYVDTAYPTVKALVDGLVDFGVFPDDDSKYLPEMTFMLAPGKCEKDWHVITLTLAEQAPEW